MTNNFLYKQVLRSLGFTGGLFCVIKELRNLVVNTFQRGLEMKNKSETFKKVLGVVTLIALVFVAVNMVQILIYDFKTQGWFGILIDLAMLGTGTLACIAARHFADKRALATYSVVLRDLLARVYTMVAYLPEGKYPVTLREMSDEDVVFYAHRVITNKDFWTEVPEKISLFSQNYVTEPYVIGPYRPYHDKELIEQLITQCIIICSDGIPRSKIKEQGQSPLLR